MPDYLIYHPVRASAAFGRHRVHFDSARGNQDPYIWNRRFLHSYCHITQLRVPQPGDLIFWVSSTDYKTLPDLLCDLVFLVDDRVYWPSSSSAGRRGCVAGADSSFAYADHYRWAKQHPLTRRRRYTLKAHAEKSFQPQKPDGMLLDIRPMLLALGVSQGQLLQLHAPRGSKPLPLSNEIAKRLYEMVAKGAAKKLRGVQLARVRQRSPQLASRWP